ncbi:MAG: hypothetical protein PHT02_02780 [Tissierellia bacterium]|nr:hypothetical protein [Tissierellia bacterium]
MNILYRSNKLEKQCKNYKDAQKAFNKDVAEKLHSVINFIENADNLMDVKCIPSFNLHPLFGDRQGTYAIDLGRRSGFRLIVIPLDNYQKCWTISDVNEIYKSTSIIVAVEVTNHYE